jgi:hypothetical protein
MWVLLTFFVLQNVCVFLVNHDATIARPFAATKHIFINVTVLVPALKRETFTCVISLLSGITVCFFFSAAITFKGWRDKKMVGFNCDEISMVPA